MEVLGPQAFKRQAGLKEPRLLGLGCQGPADGGGSSPEPSPEEAGRAVTPGASAQDAGLPVDAHDRPRRAALEMCGICSHPKYCKVLFVSFKRKKKQKRFL